MTFKKHLLLAFTIAETEQWIGLKGVGTWGKRDRMIGIVLSLCDRTGNMVRPWVDAGYWAICVDLQHVGVRNEKGITFIGADIRTWDGFQNQVADIVFAFPPCTNRAVSGARWFQSKGLKGLIEGLEVVEACRAICEASGAPWMLENPVSTLSTYWRKPDYNFHPHEYAGYEGGSDDTYTKKTCLWTGGGFVMPEKLSVPPTDTRIHSMPPSAERANLRSVTPMGFAQAVFEANAKVIA